MTISVVLRLVEQALASGRLAGEAEIVETGERAAVRDATELLTFVTRGREGDAPVDGTLAAGDGKDGHAAEGP
jgi:hypothetical protein